MQHESSALLRLRIKRILEVHQKKATGGNVLRPMLPEDFHEIGYSRTIDHSAKAPPPS
jgi:hypothetical protein